MTDWVLCLRQLALAPQPQAFLRLELRHAEQMIEDFEPVPPGEFDQFDNGPAMKATASSGPPSPIDSSVSDRRSLPEAVRFRPPPALLNKPDPIPSSIF